MLFPGFYRTPYDYGLNWSPSQMPVIFSFWTLECEINCRIFFSLSWFICVLIGSEKLDANLKKKKHFRNFIWNCKKRNNYQFGHRSSILRLVSVFVNLEFWVIGSILKLEFSVFQFDFPNCWSYCNFNRFPWSYWKLFEIYGLIRNYTEWH